jgi:exonuclease III
MLFWNVRGMNDPAKRSAIRDFPTSLHVSIVCISETKVAEVDEFYVSQCLGPSFDGFVFLPADETRGGVVMAWDTSVIQIGHVSFDTYAITGEVMTIEGAKWWLTTVYVPQAADEKILFLEELTERRSLCPGPWVVAGDFNMILNAHEKNNENLDRNMMRRFGAFVHEHELKDLYMHGRTYTWSNEREQATLTRIDRVLVSVDWDLQHFDSVLQGLSSSVSDHAPLHLALNAAFRPKRRFKFESFWLKLEGFEEAVKEAWVCDPAIVDPFRRLDALYRNAAEHLQSWGQKKWATLS